MRQNLSQPGDLARTVKTMLGQMEKDLKREARRKKDKDKKPFAYPSILLILSCVMLCQFFVGLMLKLSRWSPAEALQANKTPPKEDIKEDIEKTPGERFS